MITNLQEWVRTVGAIAGAGTALYVAVLSIKGYRANKKLERGKWAQKLYESFYEKDIYKEIRRALDHDPSDQATVRLVLAPDRIDDFYDYLNFFEFVAFLWSSGHLTDMEVKALFGYYLGLLRNPILLAEIENPNWSYEYLAKLLKSSDFK